MKVLITGACGYIGRNLLQYFAATNHRAIALLRKEDNLKDLSAVEVREGDLNNEDFLSRATRDIDAIIHLAGSKGYDECKNKTYKAVVSNVIMTEKLVRVLKNRSTPFVFASTYWVYGNSSQLPFQESQPLTPSEAYGWTKALAEQIVRNSGLPFKIIRLTNVFGYGSGKAFDEVVSFLLKRAMNGETIRLQNAGRHRIDLICIDDVCRLLIDITAQADESYLLNLGSGIGISIAELAKMINRISEKYSGKKATIMVENPEDNPVLFADRWVDIRLLKNKFDFYPTPLHTALEVFYQNLQREKT